MRKQQVSTRVTGAIILYCLSSGSMLIVNKLTVLQLPLPALVTVCQFASASSFVYGCKRLGVLKMDDFVWSKARYYVIYVFSFALGTWTNMKVLATANVETVIVFRSCCPLVVACFDYVFYQRSCPSLRSTLSLLLITFGAVSYILNDRQFQTSGMHAYYWVSIWWVVLIFQLTYGKFLVSGIELRSLWTPVLYTNTFSVLPAICLGLLAGELSTERLDSIHLTNAALFWLFVSCGIGICISWAGFLCQSLLSATSYTVVGVMNKMLTITINVLIWDNHASGYGIFSLSVCLVGGSLYQQAPPRGVGHCPAEELVERRPRAHLSFPELQPPPPLPSPRDNAKLWKRLSPMMAHSLLQ